MEPLRYETGIPPIVRDWLLAGFLWLGWWYDDLWALVRTCLRNDDWVLLMQVFTGLLAFLVTALAIARQKTTFGPEGFTQSAWFGVIKQRSWADIRRMEIRQGQLVLTFYDGEIYKSRPPHNPYSIAAIVTKYSGAKFSPPPPRTGFGKWLEKVGL